jgi:hypothetical protein
MTNGDEIAPLLLLLTAFVQCGFGIQSRPWSKACFQAELMLLQLCDALLVQDFCLRE